MSRATNRALAAAAAQSAASATPPATETPQADTPANPIAGLLPEGAATTDDAPKDAAEATAAAPVVVVDPFAELPTVKVEDYEFRDLSGVQPGANVHKYLSVATAAAQARAHTVVGWKHSAAMITAGRTTREFKPGSVYGTIDQIVRATGRAGIPAYLLVAQVRQAQIGNKRSKYCTELPPIGWAEGWINTYISKGMGKVMEKKAPLLTPAVAEAIADAEAGKLTEAVQEEAQREAA